MGHTLEVDGFYVQESIEKDLPYFCETEHEIEMFFKSPAPVLRGSIKGILDMIYFYIFTEKNPSKQEYWQQSLLDMAQDGSDLVSHNLSTGCIVLRLCETRIFRAGVGGVQGNV